MKFNIIQHVYNHADRFFFIEGNTAKNIYTPNQVREAEKNIDDDIVNFKFSFDDVNFKNENTLEKLEKFVEDLKGIKADTSFNMNLFQRFPLNEGKEKEFEKRDDIEIISKEYVKELYYKKERDLVKYTYKKKYKREGTLDKCFVAIHTKSFEEINGQNLYDVKPHIHIVFQKSKNNFGQKYKGLINEIIKASEKNNLVVSVQKLENEFAKSIEEKKELKTLKNYLSSFSWAINKNPEYYKKIHLNIEIIIALI